MSDHAIVVEGESVSFVCEADNDPDAIENITIRWFGNDDSDRTSSHFTISTTMETGPSRTVTSTLTIDPVIHQDDGQYRCEAFNHPVLTDDSTTQLTVQCKLTSSVYIQVLL